MSKKVSIIIPNKNQYGLLKECIDSIIEHTTYPNYEIIIVENGSTDEEIFAYYDILEESLREVRVITYDEPFNYSAINNYAVKYAKGDYLLFLNNDTKVINDVWMDAMVHLLENEIIGVVGATLLYPDEKIQHVGVTFHPKYIAIHHDHNSPKSLIEEKLNTPMEVNAVTGACLLTETKLFKELGGFDENLPYAYNDVDYCKAVRAQGLKVGWTPNAQLYHYESKTRGHDNTPEKLKRLTKESEYMRSKWKI